MPPNFATIAKCSPQLLSRGVGLFGALGQSNSFKDSKEYQKVFISSNFEINDVSSSWGHSAFIANSKHVCVMGRPYDFAKILGLHRIYSFSSIMARTIANFSKTLDGGITIFPVPTLIEELNHLNAISIKCSAALTAVLTKSGQLYMFGNNRWGQCGIDNDKIRDKSASNNVYLPRLVSDIPGKIKAIALGLQHCIALTEAGTVYAWGKSERGQLGIGEERKNDKVMTPALIPNLTKIVQVDAGFSHSVAIDESGILFVWGKGMSDVVKSVGASPSVNHDQTSPRQVLLPGKRRAIEVCCSNFSVVIRADDGTVWAMGMGEVDRNAVSSPLQVQAPWTKEGEDPPPAELAEKFICLPTTRIVKGHNRVSVLVEKKSTSPFETHESQSLSDAASANYVNLVTEVYDVILHDFEAYLLPVSIAIPVSCLTDPNRANLMKPNSYYIKNYSSGWLHSLILIEPLRL